MTKTELMECHNTLFVLLHSLTSTPVKSSEITAKTNDLSAAYALHQMFRYPDFNSDLKHIKEMLYMYAGPDSSPDCLRYWFSAILYSKTLRRYKRVIYSYLLHLV